MALPFRKVPEALVVAKEYYLPPLAALPAGIVLRRDRRNLKDHPAIAALRSLAPGRKQSQPKPLPSSQPILMPQSKSIAHR
jgi:hypothetical protein